MRLFSLIVTALIAVAIVYVLNNFWFELVDGLNSIDIGN